MSLPSQTDLQTLRFAFNGEPVVPIYPNTPNTTGTMKFAFEGAVLYAPGAGAAEAAAARPFAFCAT
jgi:hypothetical protein